MMKISSLLPIFGFLNLRLRLVDGGRAVMVETSTQQPSVCERRADIVICYLSLTDKVKLTRSLQKTQCLTRDVMKIQKCAMWLMDRAMICGFLEVHPKMTSADVCLFGYNFSFPHKC